MDVGGLFIKGKFRNSFGLDDNGDNGFKNQFNFLNTNRFYLKMHKWKWIMMINGRWTIFQTMVNEWWFWGFWIYVSEKGFNGDEWFSCVFSMRWVDLINSKGNLLI